eukprot:3605480-Karenia_brevis.AAC.1
MKYALRHGAPNDGTLLGKFARYFGLPVSPQDEAQCVTALVNKFFPDDMPEFRHHIINKFICPRPKTFRDSVNPKLFKACFDVLDPSDQKDIEGIYVFTTNPMQEDHA